MREEIFLEIISGNPLKICTVIGPGISIFTMISLEFCGKVTLGFLTKTSLEGACRNYVRELRRNSGDALAVYMPLCILLYCLLEISLGISLGNFSNIFSWGLFRNSFRIFF